jgi:hypothetical protein
VVLGGVNLVVNNVVYDGNAKSVDMKFTANSVDSSTQ